MSNSEWFVYCIATIESPPRTYIGATIDLDRRLAQHNGEKKGGAKATSTRPAGWYRVCAIQGFKDSHSALSFEWHWKNFSRKLEGTPLERRKKGLEKCFQWAENKFPDQVLSVIYEHHLESA